MSNMELKIWLIIFLVCIILSIVFAVYQFILYCIAYRRHMKKREEKRQQNKEVMSNKPYREWKVTIKEVGREFPIHTELHGPYDLDDVKEHFGLEESDVEWYRIIEMKCGCAMIKHKQHTDPDQSERLIKAGLDIDTADMHYRDGAYHQGKPDMNTMAVVAPIWSAYALRKLIPTKIRKDLDGTKVFYRIGWEPTQRGFVVFYIDDWWHSFTLVKFECEDLNDGYIDMMCWLLDNGYVEKKGGER